VNKAGLVKGLKKGTATVTCKIVASGKTYTLKAKVSVLTPATKIVINNKVSTMKVGDTLDLNRTLTPKTSNDKTTWTSSDKSIANPDKYGKFTALKSGKVTITGTTLSGKKDSVTITVTDVTKDITINSTDVKDGAVKVASGTYRNIIIENSVGDADISLNNVKVVGALFMQTGAAYTVTTKDSQIANVKVVKPEITSMAQADEKVPSLVAGRGTVIVNIDVNGTVTITQTGMAKIENLVVTTTSASGEITVSLTGFTGNIVVNSSSTAPLKIETTACQIKNVTIENTVEGSVVSFTDTFAGTASASSINKIDVKSGATINVDVPTKEIVVDAKASKVALVVSKPVEKVTNNGTGTVISATEKDLVKKVEGTEVKVGEVTPTPSVTPTPTPTTPSNPVVTPGTPTPTPVVPSTETPGITKNNNTYTFDEHVVAFDVKVGDKLYPVTIEALLQVARDWSNSSYTYVIPNSNGLMLGRTSSLFVYNVIVPNTAEFRLTVDIINKSVTVVGSSFQILNVVRAYAFDSQVTGITIKVGTNSYDITEQAMLDIAAAWSTNVATYTVPGTNLTLKRTATPFVYQADVTGYESFFLGVDVANRVVAITGGAHVIIEKTTRTFEFDSHVISFKVSLGGQDYLITRAEVEAIAAAWPINQDTYQIPGKNVTLKRTATPFVYEAIVPGNLKFTLAADLANNTVKVSGTNDFTVKEVSYRYTFNDAVTGFTVRVGMRSFDLTAASLIATAAAWDNNYNSYVVDGQDLVLKRTATPFTYQVLIPNVAPFTMAVDIEGKSVTVSGGTYFSITNMH
jgi:hypothetical protein